MWNFKKFVHPHLNSKSILIHSSKNQLGQTLEDVKRFLASDKSIASIKNTIDGGISNFNGAYNPSTSMVDVTNTPLFGSIIDQCSRASLDNNAFQTDHYLSFKKKTCVVWEGNMNGSCNTSNLYLKLTTTHHL